MLSFLGTLVWIKEMSPKPPYQDLNVVGQRRVQFSIEDYLGEDLEILCLCPRKAGAIKLPLGEAQGKDK